MSFYSAWDPGDLQYAVCQSDSGNPNPTLLWKRSNVTTILDTDDDLYSLTELEFASTHNGKYVQSGLALYATIHNDGIPISCVAVDEAGTVLASSGSTEVRLKGEHGFDIRNLLVRVHYSDIGIEYQHLCMQVLQDQK
jgi:hypothetical protein